MATGVRVTGGTSDGDAAEWDALWDALIGPFRTMGSTAAILGTTVTEVAGLVRRGELVAVRTADGYDLVPDGLIPSGRLIPGLDGIVRVLRSGTGDEYAIALWLLTPGEDGETPVDALRGGRVNEVRIRAGHAAREWRS